MASFPAGPYELLNELALAPSASTAAFSQLLGAGPRVMDREESVKVANEFETIRAFQQTTIDVFRAALCGELPAYLADLLLNDAPPGFREEYHLSLGGAHWSLPLFFRTDEAKPGEIVEIQAPGSLWGEAELVERYFTTIGALPAQRPTLARLFTDAALACIGELPVAVMHMVDNASSPAAMRFFIAATRPRLKYFGYDPGIPSHACSLIRSHSFFGLMGQNYTKLNLERCLEGSAIFDHPPHILFGQKAPLILPFLEETAGHFSDEIRALLVTTTVLGADGHVIAAEDAMSAQQFAELPRSRRQYFLKYAGCDVSRNWGSRAVYNLGNISREQCLHRLKQAADDTRRGGLWVLQPRVVAHENVEFYNVEGSIQSRSMVAKFSVFHGPQGALSATAQYRDFYKVHGQSDTVMTSVVDDATIADG